MCTLLHRYCLTSYARTVRCIQYMQFIFSCANNVSPCLLNVLATAALNALLIPASSRNPQNRAAKYIFLSSKEAPAFPHMMYHRLNNTTSMIFLIKTSLILPPIVVPFPATFNTRRLTPPLSFFLPRIASAVATTAWTSPLRGTATNLRRLEEEATATAGGAGRGQPRRGGEAETW